MCTEEEHETVEYMRDRLEQTVRVFVRDTPGLITREFERQLNDFVTGQLGVPAAHLYSLEHNVDHDGYCSSAATLRVNEGYLYRAAAEAQLRIGSPATWLEQEPPWVQREYLRRHAVPLTERHGLTATHALYQGLPGPYRDGLVLDPSEIVGQVRLAQAVRRAKQAHMEAAETRAQGLLLSLLDQTQRAQWERERAFVVRVGARRYRIRMGVAGNVDLLGQDGQVEEQLCCHLSGNLPRSDHMVAQLLTLRHNEGEFRRLANIHYRRGEPRRMTA